SDEFGREADIRREADVFASLTLYFGGDVTLPPILWCHHHDARRIGQLIVADDHRTFSAILLHNKRFCQQREGDIECVRGVHREHPRTHRGILADLQERSDPGSRSCLRVRRPAWRWMLESFPVDLRADHEVPRPLILIARGQPLERAWHPEFSRVDLEPDHIARTPAMARRARFRSWARPEQLRNKTHLLPRVSPVVSLRVACDACAATALAQKIAEASAAPPARIRAACSSGVMRGRARAAAHSVPRAPKGTAVRTSVLHSCQRPRCPFRPYRRRRYSRIAVLVFLRPAQR